MPHSVLLLRASAAAAATTTTTAAKMHLSLDNTTQCTLQM